MRRVLIFGLLLSLIAPLAAQNNVLQGVTLQQIATGLQFPINISNAGDGSGRLFINEQRGRVRVYDGQNLLETPFLDIQDRVTGGGGGSEQGLLGLAFHPDYENNGLFYVNYTEPGDDTVVSRFQVTGNPNVADPNSESPVLTQNQPRANHNGGQLQFGPDGFLYIAFGDGGNFGSTEGQNLGTWLGKILRIDVNGGSPFAVPAGNPFVSRAGARPEIWVWGLRNPWRFSFDRQSGDMFLGDVGENSFEEIDFQAAASPGGENYGWRIMEGNSCLNPQQNCNDGSLTLPILTYANGQGRCSVTGGYRYRGTRMPQLQGVYLFADYCSGEIFAATEENGEWTPAGTMETGFNISTFGEDEAGEIYVAHHGGSIHRLRANAPTPSLTQLSPSDTAAGGSAFTLAVTGQMFVPGSQVRWNGEARPTTFINNNTLQATISAADIAAAGTAQISVLNPAPGGGVSNAVEFSIEATTISPIILTGGVVNGASFAAGEPVVPGSIASVFGESMATGTARAEVTPLPTTLAAGTLRFNGDTLVPQFFASPGQMNIQIPWELAGESEAQLTASVGDQTSPPVAVSLAAYRPGLFSANPGGAGQGAILIANSGGFVAAPVGAFSKSRPVERDGFLEIFATGLGDVTNRPPTGEVALSSPLSRTTVDPVVTIGGRPVRRVLFSGLAPGFAGLYQVNVELDPDTPVGNAVDVVLTIADQVSNTVTVAVE